MIDKSLIGNEYDEEIIRLIKIAYDCVQPFPHQRPTMVEVYQKTWAVGVRYGIAYDFRIVRRPQIAAAAASTGDEIIEIETAET